MITISEAITTIKKAENDAEGLLEDANERSSKIIEEANEQIKSLMDETKESAQAQGQQIIFKAETNAKNDANRILRETDAKVTQIKERTASKIDDAVAVIIEHIL
jgi:V/A-type H+-transporting ATPase subunit G/H